MRVADKMNFDQVNTGLQKNRLEMADLQNQAATQKRLNKPSDDPLAATRVLATRTSINSSQQFVKNINQAKTFLEYSDQSLGELADLLMRAKDLAISQANDASASAATRQVSATEVRQLLGQSVQVGNRQLGDRFLFGGFKTTNPPFGPKGEYAGDDGEIRVLINREAQVGMNIPGSKVFFGKNLRGSAEPSSQKDPLAPVPAQENAPTTLGEIRGPASRDAETGVTQTWRSSGTNIFSVLSDLEVSLKSNFKPGIQDSLERLDEAIAQVVLARSEVGSRLATLNNAQENLSKGVVDSKALASSLEDVDTFELVSELNKSESTLKASLASSGKLIQPSLLDFLK